MYIYSIRSKGTRQELQLQMYIYVYIIKICILFIVYFKGAGRGGVGERGGLVGACRGAWRCSRLAEKVPSIIRSSWDQMRSDNHKSYQLEIIKCGDALPWLRRFPQSDEMIINHKSYQLEIIKWRGSDGIHQMDNQISTVWDNQMENESNPNQRLGSLLFPIGRHHQIRS